MLIRWLRRLSGRPASPRIYLHIGAMKTGTTFLQGLMSTNRRALREAGFLFPGSKWSEQERAVRDILFTTDDPRTRALTDGRWEQLRDEMLAHRGRASIVSMEFLSFADAEQAARILESLEAAEVHVILTVRDAKDAIPAQWQTSCRSGGRISYRRLVRAMREVMDDEDPPSVPSTRLLLRTQGIPRMLDVWVPLVGAKRVHVITVPPRGADPMVLWRRFARVIGVRPTVCSLMPQDSNPSLGHASAELLRLVNEALGPTHPIDYNQVVKGGLARLVLTQRAHLESPVRLNQRGVNLATRWNGRVREAIEAHGVRVVGSLDDLPVSRPARDNPEELPQPTAEELLAAAATARDGLAAMVTSLSAEAGDPPAEPEPDLPTTADRWDGDTDPVGAAVAEVTALVRTCLALHHRVNAA